MLVPLSGKLKVPPPPSDVERDFTGGAAEFWTFLTGPKVQLTPVEIGVVQGRLNDNAEKERQKKSGGKSAALTLALLFVWMTSEEKQVAQLLF